MEISQIGRRLVLLGWHQDPIPAQEIVFLAYHDLRVAFGEIVLRPIRTQIGVVDVFLVDGPRTRQSVVDRRDDIVKDFWIGLVAIDAFLENRLVIEVQGQTDFIVSARSLEAAGLDFEYVVDAVAVLVDPLADRVARECRVDLLGPVAPVGEDATKWSYQPIKT